MLEIEARWFGRQLKRHGDADLFPMCNVGSADAGVHEREQPWIRREVFAPLQARPGQRIVNIDLFPGPGVDLVGDLMDEAFIAKLAAMGCKSVFCSNVLEHVPSPARIAASLTMFLPPGGLLFISVPRAFPYHPDPIDTMFRPSPEELAALFPQTAIEEATVLKADTALGYTLRRGWQDPGALFKTIVQKLNPFQRSARPDRPVDPNAPKSIWTSHLPWLFRRFEVTCLVLRKLPAAALSEPAAAVSKRDESMSS